MKFSNILWGLVFVFFGIVIGLNALEITNINIFFPGWWTLFLIIPGLIGLICEKEKISNLIIFIIGILLLLSIQNVINFSLLWKLFLPIILVLIGLSLIFKDTFKKQVKKEIKEFDTKDSLEYVATFSTQNLNFQDEKFSSCKLTSVFGGIKCNLQDSDLAKETLIKVKIVSTSIFGGVSNKHSETKDSKKVIYIEATCLFGGVDVK